MSLKKYTHKSLKSFEALVIETPLASVAFWTVYRALFTDCPFSKSSRDIVIKEIEYFYNFYRFGGLDLTDDDFDYINDCEYTQDLLELFQVIDEQEITQWVTLETIHRACIVNADGMIFVELNTPYTPR